jgi:hypothetical protein
VIARHDDLIADSGFASMSCQLYRTLPLFIGAALRSIIVDSI